MQEAKYCGWSSSGLSNDESPISSMSLLEKIYPLGVEDYAAIDTRKETLDGKECYVLRTENQKYMEAYNEIWVDATTNLIVRYLEVYGNVIYDKTYTYEFDKVTDADFLLNGEEIDDEKFMNVYIESARATLDLKEVTDRLSKLPEEGYTEEQLASVGLKIKDRTHSLSRKIRKLGVNEIRDFDAHMCKIASQLLHEHR